MINVSEWNPCRKSTRQEGSLAFRVPVGVRKGSRWGTNCSPCARRGSVKGREEAEEGEGGKGSWGEPFRGVVPVPRGSPLGSISGRSPTPCTSQHPWHVEIKSLITLGPLGNTQHLNYTVVESKFSSTVFLYFVLLESDHLPHTCTDRLSVYDFVI